MAEPTESPPNPFADDPPLSRLLRRGDKYLGLAEQVALLVLGAFLVFVCLAWLITEHFASKPLENASADVRYTVYLMAMIGGAYAAHNAFTRGEDNDAFALLDRLLDVGSSRASPRTGNGNGNGHRVDELAIRATIAARARTRAAPGSGSASVAAGDRHRDRQAEQPPASA